MSNIVIVTPGPVSQEWEMICPGCRRDDRIHIQATVTVLLTRRGTEEVDSDTEWDDASIAQCRHCDHTGTVRDFCDAFSSLRGGGR